MGAYIMHARFTPPNLATLILDFDSTFTCVEALDILAEQLAKTDPSRTDLALIKPLTDQAMSGEEGIGHGPHTLADKSWNIPGEDHGEAVILHAPAHYIPGVGPRVLAPRADMGPGRIKRRTIKDVAVIGAQDKRRRPIAEQRRGDDVGLAVIAATERKAAKLRA